MESEIDQSIKPESKTSELIFSEKPAEQVFQQLKENEELQDPVRLFYNGEKYFCPFKDCKPMAESKQEIKNHIEELHEVPFKQFFIEYYDELVVSRENWVTHSERFSKYQEKLDKEVYEYQEIIDNYEHGVMVCVLCGDGYKIGKEAQKAKKHKFKVGHNIWVKRLNMPDGFDDPMVKD